MFTRWIRRVSIRIQTRHAVDKVILVTRLLPIRTTGTVFATGCDSRLTVPPQSTYFEFVGYMKTIFPSVFKWIRPSFYFM